MKLKDGDITFDRRTAERLSEMPVQNVIEFEIMGRNFIIVDAGLFADLMDKVSMIAALANRG